MKKRAIRLCKQATCKVHACQGQGRKPLPTGGQWSVQIRITQQQKNAQHHPRPRAPDWDPSGGSAQAWSTSRVSPQVMAVVTWQCCEPPWRCEGRRSWAGPAMTMHRYSRWLHEPRTPAGSSAGQAPRTRCAELAGCRGFGCLTWLPRRPCLRGWWRSRWSEHRPPPARERSAAAGRRGVVGLTGATQAAAAHVAAAADVPAGWPAAASPAGVCPQAATAHR